MALVCQTSVITVEGLVLFPVSTVLSPDVVCNPPASGKQSGSS